MKRVIFLMLALLMLGVVLVSCSPDSSGGKDGNEEYSKDDVVVGEDGRLYDKNGFLMDDIGDEDFNGKQITISGWTLSAVCPKFAKLPLNTPTYMSPLTYLSARH